MSNYNCIVQLWLNEWVKSRLSFYRLCIYSPRPNASDFGRELCGSVVTIYEYKKLALNVFWQSYQSPEQFAGTKQETDAPLNRGEPCCIKRLASEMDDQKLKHQRRYPDAIEDPIAYQVLKMQIQYFRMIQD